MSNKKVKAKRKVKVYARFQNAQHKIVVVPEIRLTGKWLERFGFEFGKFVEVNCEQNKITITLVDEREP